jgi:hypothetical protein
MRTWYYFAHHLTYESLKPQFVRVRPLGADRTLVEVHGALVFYPKRSIFIPATLLLPRSISATGVWKIGIKGPLHTGQVRHNIHGPR